MQTGQTSMAAEDMRNGGGAGERQGQKAIVTGRTRNRWKVARMAMKAQILDQWQQRKIKTLSGTQEQATFLMAHKQLTHHYLKYKKEVKHAMLLKEGMAADISR